MTTEQTPERESELWSYPSSSDGINCPMHDACQVKNCADDASVIAKSYLKDCMVFMSPVHTQGRKMETVGILPVDTPSGLKCTIDRTFTLTFSLDQ